MTDCERNLAMMLRRFIWQANKLDGDHSLKVLAGKAGELLKQYGLSGTPLRELDYTRDPINQPENMR